MARPSLVRSMNSQSASHQRQRDAQDENLHGTDGDRAEVIELLLDSLGKRHLLAAENVDREILQDDGETDGADQRRQRTIFRDRPDGDEIRPATPSAPQPIIAPSSAT